MAVFAKVVRSSRVIERPLSKKEQAWLAKYCDVCKRTLNQCELDSCERW